MRIYHHFLIFFTYALMSILVPLKVMADEKPMILVDIPPVYHLVKAIVDDKADVEILLDPDFSAHHFSLAPSQVQKIENADYIMGIGSNFLPNLVKSARNVNENSDHIYFYYDDVIENSNQPIDNPDDPHYWLSPDELLNMQRYFADRLLENSELAPVNFVPHLAVGHVQMPKPNAALSQPRPLIASHEAFDYFEKSFGMESYGALSDINDQSLPPRQYAEKIFHIQNGDIRCIISEKAEHSHDMDDLAHEYELEEAEFDILGWQWAEAKHFFPTYFNALIDIYTNCGA